MIKIIVKILSIILLILIIVISYLSFFGIKTTKFNSQIKSNILKINKNINLNLGEVNYILNPYNFSVNVKTKNPQILLRGRKLEIKIIKTNVSLKSLINNQFAIDELKITTKEIDLNDIIASIRIFQNSPQLFVLNTITEGGFATANINLKFDDKGKVQDNYQIKGSVKKAKFNFLNQFKLQNLNFNFDISNSNYLLKQIDAKINNIKISSSLVEIEKKKDSLFVNGEFLSDKKKFDIQELKLILSDLFNNIDIKKIEFSSINNFSFEINKRLKLNNFKAETIINLDELIFNEKNFNLKSYLPNFLNDVKLKNHKITLNYDKNKFHLRGNGNIILGNKSDSLSYQIIKNKENLLFDSKINLKNNSLLINFLDYEKKEGLNLDKDFKIIDIKNFKINYKNNKKILNKINLKKDNSDFILLGESFDASRIIDNIMDSDEKSSSFLANLNSKINIRIEKMYIDEFNYMNNLYGDISFKKNKVNDLKLESFFKNKKKINLSITTNNNSETITKLFSAYPKPLIKRYNFIKGFEEGYLDFHSIKKGDISNSVLIIDNFKVKEVPAFAKLLSLASLQGIADLLTGEGIRFTDFEMNFSNQKGVTTIDEMYAIGPAVSILMDGYIESKKLVSLRGTLVPATTINRSIASIPLLGKILIGDKTGEGIFGVSFKIKGTPKNLKTTVNPIKSLTPRFITRTLEKIK